MMTLRIAPLLLAACSAGWSQSPSGARLFDIHCSACHQTDGQGMGEAPPLIASPWVVGPEERLVKIILHGVRGRMEVHGRIYDREMPGFGGSLSDKQIAALLTYVRRAYGAPSSAVSEATVRRLRRRYHGRADYWRVEELLADPE